MLLGFILLVSTVFASLFTDLARDWSFFVFGTLFATVNAAGAFGNWVRFKGLMEKFDSNSATNTETVNLAFESIYYIWLALIFFSVAFLCLLISLHGLANVAFKFIGLE